MVSEQHKLYIGGQWVAADGGRTFAVINPATGEQLATVSNAGASDTERAIAAAADAFRLWAGLQAHERSHYLRRLYGLLMRDADKLAELVTLEQGKPLAEARAEVVSGAEYVNWYADEARRIYGELVPAHAADTRVAVLRQPIGVVAAITPWNFPSSMVTRKLAPALAAGCTVVLKPAEDTPLSALAIAELVHEAELPAGVVNVVTTDDPQTVGDVLLSDPRVRKISFTGSTAVGKQLLAGAATQVKRVSLEMGGNAPFIVFADADLDEAVQHAVQTTFRNTGQTCICTNRIYVESPILKSFTERFAAAVSQLKVGSGFDPACALGPLINEAAYIKVEQHVTNARALGASVLTGGQRLAGPEYSGGFYYAPTVLADVSEEMQVASEETFGPVAPILSFATEAEVITRANATPYGLAAYLFTRDVGRMTRVSEQLEFGMVGLNGPAPGIAQAPFGGVKSSGLGREGGHYGLEPYLEYKYVALRLT